MKYDFVYTRRAEKDLRKLDKAVRNRIGKTMLQYRAAPLKHAEKLTGEKLGMYRFRIGDYRVVFDIVGNDVVVLRVGHRKEIYRR